jgi:membrane dipeptidase
MRRGWGVAAACALACGSQPPPVRSRVEAPVEAKVDASPGESQASGVVDLHVDLPYALLHHALGDAQASPARLERGGVSVIVAPLFVRGAYAMHPPDVRTAYEAAYTRLLASGVPKTTTAWLSLEGADGFADEQGLTALDGWMARGVCLVGLVHDHSNALGGASQDPSPDARARGLSELGKRIAAHVVARGGLLDVAHASDATFDDLAAIALAAHAPLVDSHTGMRALRATMRNIDDGQVRVVAASGGVVGMSVHGGHIGKTPGEHPTLADVADHVVHALAVAGPEHVAIGSDFDGSIDPPADADGESVWPALRRELAARGLDARVIDAIFSGNARRVFAFAKGHGCDAGAR